jgi:hypothetical protein
LATNHEGIILHMMYANAGNAGRGALPGRGRLAGFLLVVLALLGAWILASCTKDEFGGKHAANLPPDTWVASGPPDSSVSGFQVHFFWGGFDPDGSVRRFEYLITDNGPGGFDPADTVGYEKWKWIEIGDSVFTVKADLPDLGDPNGQTFIRSHTFLVRAVDGEGIADPTPAYRSFTASTLAPEVDILTPENPRPGDIHYLPNSVTFTWEATDEGGTLAADSVRWGVFRAGDNTPQALQAMLDTLHRRNDDPLWGPWISYSAPEDSGKRTLISNLEFPPTNFYALVVQAKDLAAAITPTFDVRRNVRKIGTKRPSGPLLYVQERFIGTVRFLGLDQSPSILAIPSGLPLNFTWEADASADGQTIAGFRYGWDITDPNDPEEWPVASDPLLKRAPTVVWNFGQHLLLVEAKDNAGAITMARIQVNIVPFPMDRPVLWVDDSRDANLCTDEQRRPLDYCDEEHDAEWLEVLQHVDGFEAERDVYEVSERNFQAPPVELIGHYQNIIWNTGGVEQGTQPDALSRLIRFIPQCVATGKVEVNSLASLLGKGGHLWLCGKYALSMSVPGGQSGSGGRFPVVLRTELAQQCARPGQVDTSGVTSFPYEHIGLVALDRSTGIEGQLRDGVARRTARDDGLFEAQAINPDFPELDSLDVAGGGSIPIGIPTLTGKELFVGPGGGYRDPLNGERIGFASTDILDSQYWLQRSDVNEPLHREVFVPLWRHTTRGTSILMRNVEVNGGWSTVHAWRQAELPGGQKGVMAKSLYMGFEPYYFEFEQFERLANYVLFKEWQLRYRP